MNLRRQAHRWMLLLLLALALAAVVTRVLAGMAPGAVRWPIFSQVFLFLTAVAHMALCLDTRRTLGFTLLSYGIGGLGGLLAVKTSLMTPIVYSSVLGPSLLGLPVVLPLGLTGLLYLATATANLMLEADVRRVRGGARRQILAALLTALVFAGSQLSFDPFMSGKLKAWQWLQGGQYLGTPFAAFVVYGTLAFLVSLLDRLLAREAPPLPYDPPSPWLQGLPLVLFALVTLSDTWRGFPETTRILMPFVAGGALMAALGRLLWKAERFEQDEEGGAQ